MAMIILHPTDEERDGGKGTRAILQAMREITRREIGRGREEEREARRRMWRNLTEPRNRMSYRTSI